MVILNLLIYFVFQSTFNMKSETESIEDIKAIRKIMEDSSRFLSLSGHSGVFAGILAIAGALVAWFFILVNESYRFTDYIGRLTEESFISHRWLLLADAGAVLLLSVMFAVYFSIRKARRDGKAIWNPVSRRLLINLFIPLTTGGIFIIAILMQGYLQLAVPCFLIFYGLALVNAGKFTIGEVLYLGILEIITGLVSVVVPGWDLIFWVFGFGILHIFYGLAMYRKYKA